MADKSILIIGLKNDPHVEKVAELVSLNNFTAHILDRHELSAFVTLNYSNRRPQFSVYTENIEKISLSSVKSVWWRLKPVFASDFVGGKASTAEKFRGNEWKAFLYSLNTILEKATWINDISAHSVFSNKPRQLAIAQKVGFSIPKTIITNLAKDVLEYFKPNEKIIYKTLDSFIAPPDEIVFTNEISREQILQSKFEISLAPCIFQKYISKEFELRVTVVGNKVFCVKIDSQKYSDTSVDWRKNQFLPMYEEWKLSRETESMLLKLHHLSGLKYGAYDFIVEKKTGKEIFLECNPGGQWLWLENRLGIPITDSIVKLLM